MKRYLIAALLFAIPAHAASWTVDKSRARSASPVARPARNSAAASKASTLPLLRTDYGVGNGSWSTGQWVALSVDVTLHLVAMEK